MTMGFTAFEIASGWYAAFLQSAYRAIIARSLFTETKSYGFADFFAKIAGLGSTASAACWAAYKYEENKKSNNK